MMLRLSLLRIGESPDGFGQNCQTCFNNYGTGAERHSVGRQTTADCEGAESFLLLGGSGDGRFDVRSGEPIRNIRCRRKQIGCPRPRDCRAGRNFPAIKLRS